MLLEEKEERIRHLKDVNMTLKQTNDDLNEEVSDLKRQLTELQGRVCKALQSGLHPGFWVRGGKLGK